MITTQGCKKCRGAVEVCVDEHKLRYYRCMMCGWTDEITPIHSWDEGYHMEVLPTARRRKIR